MKNLSFASACVIQQYSSATSFKKNLYYRILFIVVHIYFCIFLERVFQNNNFSIFAAFFVILDVVVVVAVMVLRHWTYVLVLLLDKSINRLLFGKIMFLVVKRHLGSILIFFLLFSLFSFFALTPRIMREKLEKREFLNVWLI